MKTDTQLKHDVMAALQWEPSINVGQVGIEVIDGIVTMAGQVTSYAEKWETERAVQRVSGVKAIASQIDVMLPLTSQRHDADIAISVENVLHWMSYLPKDSVKVDVKKGWITLSGAVEWEFQRQAVRGAVRFLIGVKGVVDDIAVQAIKPAPRAHVEIKAAAQPRPQFEEQHTSAQMLGAGVMLAGAVDNWHEPEVVSASFWRTAYASHC
ncbi:MAG: BON domain-containing protein [Undibacterium sp.]|uniref:BON domain-containing protein n=1 Tax=Undibacterium sp. TaxID=1914977 RepID=UPI0027286DC7|nr:BON domain-containing protein [Undibacterium sp.]MDO8653566.1 BON domain-containing protein [Undibacterium sp.]